MSREASLVVKSPPASAGDMGSIPDPGRSHVLQSSWAWAPQLLSLFSRAHAPQLEIGPHLPQLEKSLHSTKVPTKNKNF